MITTLELNKQRVRIDAGELVGYTVDGHEFIHQKGSPGWGSADAEMFPIIGPVNEAGFKVRSPRGDAVQDQHGLLRQMPYELVSATTVKAVYRKIYKAGTPIKNSKYPEKSSAEWMSWPYSFEFEKKYALFDDFLKIDFIISGEEGMPFMLGYHPAFKLHADHPIVRTKKRGDYPR